MARIAGVNIPREKRVEIGLTYIFGIGRSTSNKVLKELGLNPDTKVRDLTEEEVARLRNHIDSSLTVEGDLRRERSRRRSPSTVRLPSMCARRRATSSSVRSRTFVSGFSPSSFSTSFEVERPIP